MTTEGSLVGVGRLRIAYRTWEPRNPRAGIVLVHGFGEHSARYAEFAGTMAGLGIATYALDLRGHGLSEGRRGHVPAFDIFLQELDRFRREVEGLAGFGLPLFLLGHSLGGLIALRYLEEYSGRFRGGVICSPWIATAMEVPRWKVTLSGMLSKVLPSLPFSAGIDPQDVSRDPAIVEAYRNDPLVHDRLTPRFFSEISMAMGLALQRSDRIREPILFMAAGNDRLVSTERSLMVARSITAPDITIRVYPGHYHELLNEPDRAVIHREVRDWIAARV